MSNLDRRYGTDSKPQSMLGRPGLLQIGRGTTGREVRYPNEPRMVTAAGANARDAAQAAADLAKIKANAADRAAGVSTPGVSTQDIATAAQNVAVNNAASNVEVAPTPTPETPASPVNNVAASTQVSRDLMTHKGNTQGNIWARPTSLNPRSRMGVNSDESRLSPEINTALGNVGNALAQAGNVLGGIAKGTVNALASAFIHADEFSGTGNANILSPKTMMALGFSQESIANAGKKEEAFDALNIPDAADVAASTTKSVDEWSQTWVPAPSSKVGEKAADVFNALGEAVPGIVVGALTGGVGSAVIGGTVAGRLVGASNAFTKEYVASGKNYDQALLAGGIEYAAEAAGAKLFSGASDALVDNLISPLGKGIANTGSNVLSEGLEEVISGSTHAMLTGTPYTAEQARDEMLIGALVGGAAGGLAGGPTSPIRATVDTFSDAISEPSSTNGRSKPASLAAVIKSDDLIKGGGRFIEGGATLTPVGEPSVNLGNLTEVEQPDAKELIRGGATVAHESIADMDLVPDLPRVTNPNFGSDSTLNVGNLTPAKAKGTETITSTRSGLTGVSGGQNLSQRLGNLTDVPQPDGLQVTRGGGTVSFESQADLSIVAPLSNDPNPNFGTDSPLNDTINKGTLTKVPWKEGAGNTEIPSLGVIDGAKYIADKNREAAMYRQVAQPQELEVLRGGSNVALTSDADLSIVDEDGNPTPRVAKTQDNNMRPINPRPYVVPNATTYTSTDSTPNPSFTTLTNNPYATQDSITTESVAPRSEDVGGVSLDGSAVPSTPETEPWKFPDTEPSTPEVSPTTPKEVPEAPARILEPFDPEIWPGVEPGEQPDVIPDDVPQIQPRQPDTEPEPIQEPEPETEPVFPTRDPHIPEPGKILPFPGTQEPTTEPVTPPPEPNPEPQPEPEIEPASEPPEITPEVEPDVPVPDVETAPDVTPSEETETTPEPRTETVVPEATPSNPSVAPSVSTTPSTETSTPDIMPEITPNIRPTTMPYESPGIATSPSPNTMPGTSPSPNIAPEPGIAPEPAPETVQDTQPAINAATELSLDADPELSTEPSPVAEKAPAPELAFEPNPELETETSLVPQAAPAAEISIAADMGRRRDPLPQTASGLFAGLGSQGRIYDTQGYDRTFGGLSSG